MTFSEVRTEPEDFMQLGQVSIDSAIPKKMSTSRRGGVRDFDSSSSPATASSSGGRSPIVETGSSSSRDENQSEPGQKAGFNWWKRRRLSFSMTWRREPVRKCFTQFSKPGSLLSLNRTGLFLQREDEVTKTSTKPSEEPEKPSTAATELTIEANKWVMKDLVSRDGKSKLQSEVYSASIDQRSEQAAGEAACAAVAVVVAHWFHANPKLINPSGTEFDSLITQGSSLWQSLCDKESYLRLFPNRHFDLETIVSANLRPVRVCTEKSITGFFSPERFASLDGLMSFDQIWDEVEKEVALASSNGETRVYIVSWNDHFFVVKADLDGYCVIDSLGERLFEGCKQAYILKFDDSSLMYEKEESSEKLVCEGKKCCREYIKRFLAAIPVAELAAKEEKGNVVDVSLLHEKLQIDLHHIMLTNDD